MARSSKNARHITVDDTDYRWRASGDNGYASITIWPADTIGPPISCTIPYDETWIPRGDGSFSSAGDQIVVTNRLIRRVVEFAVAKHGYDPTIKSRELNLHCVDSDIDLTDAIRAGK